MHIGRDISLKGGIQTLLHTVYPPECLGCRERLAEDSGLCGTCWRDTPFISGNVCETCGAPMMGHVEPGDRCDDCMRTARPWVRGRAAMIYKDRARSLVLALKHGDRHDIVKPAAKWMARALGEGGVPENTLVVPVPLHWTRMMRRRFNQSSLLALSLAGQTGLSLCSDALVRARSTKLLEGVPRDDRFKELHGAIVVAPKRKARMAGRPVLIVDDVMTSGATLAASAEACLAAGACEVHTIVLARVVKDA